MGRTGLVRFTQATLAPQSSSQTVTGEAQPFRFLFHADALLRREAADRAVLGRRLLAQRIARLAALLDSDESTLEGARWIDLRYADRAVLRTEPVSG